MSLSIGSYNILEPSLAVGWKTPEGISDEAKTLSSECLKGKYFSKTEDNWQRYSNWNERKDKIARNIELADIVCVQEASLATCASLEPLLKTHRLAIFAPHNKFQFPNLQYGNAIFYNSTKVVPFNPSVIIYGEGRTRSAVSCCFNALGKTFKVVSVHLIGYNPSEPTLKNKSYGFEELKTYLNQVEKNTAWVSDVVIAGDMNEGLSESYCDYYRPGLLTKNKYRCDGCIVPTEPEKDRRIDWIFFKSLRKNCQPTLTPMGLENTQEVASDHLMTGTLLTYDAPA
ncbi:MAG: endonuclease/exonuclease/phosphatase family protein [Chlamydiota bacterium]|nr:endonuclease/exonuclease/phosphatase family protein [Chlamydiota bacterium]